ncbi:MAG: 16S rRNA (cytosine(967)-C(5))-methyltransferase RsmB [Clostridia bacterium]|nr:16S rRNA (cytosine(967)-C(5))-methyltransferase RsmB [Clostridia bacterium]
MQNERKVLVSALLKAEKNGYSNIILDSVLNETDLNSLGKAFVTTAFYGVLERKITIDFILNKFLKKPISKTPPYTSAVLRSGAYQILYMNKIPNSAAINEAVKLIKKSKERGNAGLVNAVLRKISNENALDILNSLQEPIVKYSVEGWIYNKLISQYEEEKINSFFENSLLPPPVFIRINTQKENAYNMVLDELENIGATINSTDFDDFYAVQGIKNVEKLKSYKNGLFFVQDYSSRFAVACLSAKSNERVLDCCAAPGGKTFSIAMDMQNSGEVVSFDIHSHRVELIKKGADRLGLDIVKASVNDATEYNKDLGLFDRVICDVPCSGMGVIRRKPEIKYKSEEECNALCEIQSKILQASAKYVKSGGRLVYSTCTLFKNENDDIVSDFLNKNKEFKLITAYNQNSDNTVTLIPPEDLGDGFFVAVMERL